MHRPKFIPGAFLCSLFFITSLTLQAQIHYPVTKRIDHTDTYFGVKVSDPYRWLENDTAADTRAWMKAEQQCTENYLSKIPFRNQIRKRYETLLKGSKYSDVFNAGGYIFFSKNDGTQNQPVRYYQKGLHGTSHVFIDPNTLSRDGSVSLGYDGISNNKKYMVYHLNKAGSDWITLYIMDIATHKRLKDEIKWMKFGGIAWCGDGFYYSRYARPTKGTALVARNLGQKVYYHRLGDSQEKDRLIYEDTKHPEMYLTPQVTEDEHYLLITLSPGDGTEIWCKDLTRKSSPFTLLIRGFKFDYWLVTDVRDGILFNTNDGADNYHIIKVDPEHPGRTFRTVVLPEQSDLLQAAASDGGMLFCTFLKDASSRIREYTEQGKWVRNIALPGLGTSSEISGFRDDTLAFYDFTSYTCPPSIYCYHIASGKSELFKRSETSVNTNDYTTDQVFYHSKDGTRVPMFIVHKKGMKLDGSHPTELYAYGGFDISITPHFISSEYVLLEQNGVYAVANIRGGGEYGEKWHRAGNLLHKQNVFDDFIAAGQYLIQHKYTRHRLLAIDGRSNGGLLIGAVMTQKPHLAKVAFPEVGVQDMLRFQKFTVGWGWAVEYGSSDSAKYFPYLLKYSPLQNVRKGVSYPATMVMTADHDDRVVPAHSFKFAATLQADQAGKNPVLLRISKNQGHGASGFSLSQNIKAESDKWSFMFYNMGIVPKY